MVLNVDDIKLEDYNDDEEIFITFVVDDDELEDDNKSKVLSGDNYEYQNTILETAKLNIKRDQIYTYEDFFAQRHREKILCYICGKMVLSEQVTAHLKDHGTFKCSQCAALFKSDEQLQEHQKDHANRHFECTYCNLSFTKPTEFTMHNYFHTKSYKCPLCEFVTQVRQSVICHIRRHEGHFKFKCDICGKGFLTKAMLNQHEEMHLDIKRYTCQFCNKKFSVQRYLDTHQKLNHKIELFGFTDLYKCKVCGREFSFEKSLVRHLSVIHKIGEDRTVNCKVCGKRIANPYNLKMHMRVHTGEKNYVCHLCGKAFSGYKYLKKHNDSHNKKILVKKEDIEFPENNRF